MKKLALFLLLIPLLASAQIRDHKKVSDDTLEFKNFNQGYLDSQKYFNGTTDFFIGAVGISAYFTPNIICYIDEPNDRRFLNAFNPNIDYLYTDVDYYNGYKYGATKKKRKRIIQGSVISASILGTFVLVALSASGMF